MINLLPQNAQRAITRRYWMSASVLLFFGLAIALFIGGALIMPSYFIARTSADAYERYRDALEGSVGLKERAQVDNAVALLNERITILDAYEKEGAFTAEAINALGKSITNGSAVTSIAFSRREGGAALTLRGRAHTRQGLLDFAEALRASPSFTGVSLPVSQLVAETDVNFTIQAGFEKQQ